MYLQITSRCNMSCAHCGMNATAKGEDMSLETFRNALKWCDESIELGGGEPTIHPLFWQFLGEAIASADHVWLATNGSQTEIAIALARMAKRGVIGCDLSQDEYHDPIDPKVIKAFTKDKRSPFHSFDGDNDYRYVRNVTGREINAGRCDFGIDGCVCPGLIVKPNGDVHVCGCADSPCIGNVNNANGFEMPDEYEYGECWKNQLEICEG